MTESVTFVTPTYAGDFERFCLQRESIERFEISIPQVAIVHDEDLPLFKTVPHQRGLSIISTRAVLPRRIEARRQNWGRSRRDPRFWLARPPIHGWMTQQLSKLASPVVVDTEGIVCLDSEILFLAPVTASDFYSDDGRLQLYETEHDIDAEMADYTIRSMEFLGVKLTHQAVKRYTHAPAVFHRTVLLNMQQFIEDRFGKSWIQSVLDAKGLTEYATYGVFSRHLDGLEHQSPATPGLCTYYWWPEQLLTIEHDFVRRATHANARAVLVNSNLGLSLAVLRKLVETAWKASETNTIIE